MKSRCVLSDYLKSAMERAEYEKLSDDSYSGRIPSCAGVIAFAATLADCQFELQATLEDWLLLGLKLGHSLPVIGDIDLNQGPLRESVEPLQT